MKLFLAGQNGLHNIVEGMIYIYMAGGISGNLKPAFSRFAKGELTAESLLRSLINENFWRGGKSRHWIQDEISPMKEKSADENISCRKHNIPDIYCPDYTRGGFSIDGNISGRADTVQREEKYRGGFDKAILEHRPYILESFFYANEDTERLIPYFGDFMLDSGAFTFMQSSKSHVEWNDYIERYADFINRNKVEKFFELDIDSVVGYDKVLEFRKILERLTNKQCIPVWHKSRGIDVFKSMCDEYDHVAIGGIVSKEIKPEQYKAFPLMINEAHKRGAKIHGLGFTNLSQLPKIHFDSVDSTAWTTGNRFGFVYKFNGKTMIKIDCPKGKCLKDSRKIALINYTEWIKFQKYAEEHL